MNLQQQIQERSEQKQYETKVLFRESLARLLALENITVQHTNMPTAAFHLEDRILMLPNWTNVSDALYCAFIVHEVGHALYTPQDLPKEFGFVPSDVLALIANIVEDVRIEKLMLNKFPGFRTDFCKANFELKEREFYGELNFDEMNVFDRFNIHFKLGRYIGLTVPFSSEEKPYVDLIDSCETYADVVRVSIELKNKFFKKENQEQPSQQPSNQPQKNQDQDNSGQDSNEGSSQPSSDNSNSPMTQDDPTDENDSSESDSDEENGDSENEESKDGQGDSDEESEKNNSSESNSSEGDSDEEGEEKNSSGSDSSEENSNDDSQDSQSGNDSSEGDSQKSKLDNSSDGDADGDADGKPSDSNEIDGDASNSSEPEEMQGGQRTEDSKTNTNNFRPELDENNFSLKTQENFNKNQQKLASSNPNRAPMPVTFDGNVNLDEVIIDYKKILHANDWFYSKAENQKFVKFGAQHRDDFMKRNKKTLDFLVSEFNKKKSATEFHRRRESKSGTLALNKLHKYQYSEDIFQNVMIKEDGKSHGLVMYLDQSGSMDDNMTGAIEQILLLVMFCRRVSIPFRVFGFSDVDYYSTHPDADETGYHYIPRRKRTPVRSSGEKRKQQNELLLSHFNLREYFSSEMNTIDFNKMFQYLSLFAYAFESSRPRYGQDAINMPWFERLGGTPLNPAIMTGIQIIPEFKRQYKLDIVNSIFVTDGANGHSLSSFQKDRYSYSEKPRLKEQSLGSSLLLTEKVSGKTFLIENGYYGPQTRDLLSMTRQITGSKIIGFFIDNPRNIVKKAHAFGIKNASELLARDNFIEVTEEGYDVFYQIPNGASLQVRNSGGSSSDPLLRLKQAQDNVRKERILLSKFIELIS
jgi:hypothetical protein